MTEPTNRILMDMTSQDLVAAIDNLTSAVREGISLLASVIDDHDPELTRVEWDAIKHETSKPAPIEITRLCDHDETIPLGELIAEATRG